MSRSSTRRTLFVFAAVGTVGVLYYANRALGQQKQLVEVSTAYAEFRACLYGESLAPNEKGSDRLRAIELCAPPRSHWPTSCSPPLFRALNAFDKLELEEDHPVYGALRKHTRVGAEWDQELSLWLVGDPPSIDVLEEAIANAPLPTLPIVKGTKKCTEKPKFSANELTSLGSIENYRAATERVPGRVLRAIWASNESSLACSFAPDGDPVARCGSQPLANIATVIPSDDDVKELYAWNFDAKETPPYSIVSVFAHETLFRLRALHEHGWAKRDGTIFFSTSEADGLYTSKGSETKKLLGPLPKNRAFTAVRPGWVLWGETGETKKDGSQVIAKGFRLDAGDEQVVTLGPAPKRPVVRGCRNPKGELVVAMASSAGDSIHEGNDTLQNVELRVFFPTGKNTFAPAVTHTAKLGWARGTFDAVDESTVFGCTRDGAPRWLWWRKNEVFDVTCKPSGCKQSSSLPLVLASVEMAKLAIAPLGDTAAIVAYEGAYHGPVASLVHAVRVRIAPVTDLVRTPDTVLVADEHHGGLPKLWSGLFAFGRHDVGWIAVRADDALYAFRFSEKGDFVPVRTN